MINNVIMPKAGMAMEEGTVVRWLKSEGEYVKNGEDLLEIETDKVNMTIESDADGYLLKILNQAGDVVPVTRTIAYIGEKGDVIPVDTAPSAPQAPAIPTSSPVPKAAPPVEAVPVIDSGDADFDIIVVGGGPAGYIAAIQAAKLNASVALVEKDVLGGTCLNRGCIPTKTYLESAKLLDKIAHGHAIGVNVADGAVSFDMGVALKHKNEVVKKLTGGVRALLISNGVEIISGTGTISSDRKVTVGDKTYSAGKVIFAGGSLPAQLPLPGMDNKNVLSSTELLDIDTVPERLVIIGGGVIGVELACAFNSFGSSVTIIEFLDSITANMDADLIKTLTRSLTDAGICIKTSTKCNGISEQPDGTLRVDTSDGCYDADKVLVAVGRKPDLSGIEGAGVAIERGAVMVDDTMQTSVPGIYAPGDANGRLMLAHAAFDMAEVAVKNALGISCIFDPYTIPSCIYTSPEVASVGYSEEVAKKEHEVATGKFFFAANGKALAANSGDGFVKVVADRNTHEILGVHIIGPSATELINEAAVILHMEMDAEEMAAVTHAHPTCSEALFEACADCIGKSCHSLKKK